MIKNMFIKKLLDGIEIEWKFLGDVIKLKKGQQLNKTELTSEGKYPAYNGGVSYSGFTDKYNYPENTTIISQGGASAGYVNYVKTKFYANAHCYVVLPNQNMNSRYIYHFLKKQQNKLSKKQHGAGIPALRTSEINTLQIPIPSPRNPENSLEIQQKIVDVLDKFTAFKEELEKKLQDEIICRKNQYAYYKSALFKSLNCKTKPLGEIGNFIRGKRFVRKDMVEEGIPCIHYGEMYTHYNISANKSKSFVTPEIAEKLRFAQKNDVVIVAAGETIEDIGKGLAWFGDEDVVVHDACFIFKHDLNPKYVSYFLQTKQFHSQIKKYISSGKISAINAKGLEKAEIPIPSPEEQERIVSILDKFDTLINSFSEYLPKEIELRKKQYEYYRNLMFDFPKNSEEEV